MGCHFLAHPAQLQHNFRGALISGILALSPPTTQRPPPLPSTQAAAAAPLGRWSFAVAPRGRRRSRQQKPPLPETAAAPVNRSRQLPEAAVAPVNRSR
uniref:Uncharacterized protein n=1 Tax=Arundo donax TaxID=35708 RepID=A0A0A9HZ35_ARUDO